jgi:hypothetical protein
MLEENRDRRSNESSNRSSIRSNSAARVASSRGQICVLIRSLKALAVIAWAAEVISLIGRTPRCAIQVLSNAEIAAARLKR